MFYIQRQPDDPEPGPEDDDDEEALNFVFDGTVRYAASYASEGRSHITALRELVEQALGGTGDAAALSNAITALVLRVDKAMLHFQQTAQKSPDSAEFCTRSIEAYGRAREALLYIHTWLEDPRPEYLTQGMTSLERAVSDVDGLVEEESNKS